MLRSVNCIVQSEHNVFVTMLQTGIFCVSELKFGSLMFNDHCIENRALL